MLIKKKSSPSMLCTKECSKPVKTQAVVCYRAMGDGQRKEGYSSQVMAGRQCLCLNFPPNVQEKGHFCAAQSRVVLLLPHRHSTGGVFGSKPARSWPCGADGRSETSHRLLCILDLVKGAAIISQFSSNEAGHARQLCHVGGFGEEKEKCNWICIKSILSFGEKLTISSKHLQII